MTSSKAALMSRIASPAVCQAYRISPPRPSASSTCSNPAPRRRWTCSTTSRSCTICAARNYPIRYAWAIGAWLSYGLGSVNQDLPAFVVMVSQGSGNAADQPLYDRLWASGFLRTKYQGIKFRSVGDPVLYLSNPRGLEDSTRRRILDDLA